MQKMVKSGISVQKACASIKQKTQNYGQSGGEETNKKHSTGRSNCLMSTRAQLYIVATNQCAI